MSSRLIRRFGGGMTYALRRKTTILHGLKLSAAALSGATSLALTGVSQILRNGDGTAKKGSTFAIAGVSGTYTVAADAPITGNPFTLTFTPALAGPAVQNAPITWVQKYAEHSYPAMDGAMQAKTDEQMVAAGEMVRWLAYRSDAPAPEVGDELGGLSVKRVDPIGSAGVARYRVVVGAAS